MNLVCIPYAGATPICYSFFKKYLPESIHLTTVELPGRGTRTHEKACLVFRDAIEDICDRYAYLFESGDYVLYGHSMGSTMVYELTYKIMERKLPLPKHLFFSGRMAPKQSSLYEKSTNKSPEEFKKYIIELGGISEELMNYPELLNYFLKQIYEDHQLLEDYSYVEGRPPFDCAITVFYGREDDKFNCPDSKMWQEMTKGRCSIYGFSGNHFFIERNAEKIASIIWKELSK